MKQVITTILVLTTVFSYSQTQNEINKGAFEEYTKSDDLLNEVYGKIKSQYKADTLFLENLKQSQRIWIKFRDAEMAMKYPEYADYPYGTIHPTCRALYLKELTEARIQTLNQWLTGGDEVELCKGSTKSMEYIYPNSRNLAYIAEDSTILLTSNMKQDHRIFGYADKDIYSEKMILLSVFTNEVENNPFECKYGSYYETIGMKNMELKFIADEGEFYKIALVQNGQTVDTAFMLSECFVL